MPNLEFPASILDNHALVAAAAASDLEAAGIEAPRLRALEESYTIAAQRLRGPGASSMWDLTPPIVAAPVAETSDSQTGDE